MQLSIKVSIGQKESGVQTTLACRDLGGILVIHLCFLRGVFFLNN